VNSLAATFNLGRQLFSGANSSIVNPPFNDLSSIGSVVTLFLNIAFVAAGLILLFFFILGGIGLMGSAGNDDPQKMEQSKKTLTSAIIGFVIVFASYWIVKLVGQLILGTSFQLL
jgi:hypothetical protein